MSADITRCARSLAAIALLGSLTSCALPPREAWRVVQTQGLFAYLSGDFVVPAYGTETRYVAYGEPLQPRFMHPVHRPQAPALVHEPVYRGQRYFRPPPPSWEQLYSAPYPMTPYSPPRTITPYTPPRRVPSVAAAPKPAPSPSAAPTTKTPQSKGAVADKLPLTPPSPAATSSDMPYGTAVPGRPGMVNSPYAQKQQLVDVTGMAVGQAVKCPYTGKLFRVPPTQQAGATQPTEPAAKPDAESKPQPR